MSHALGNKDCCGLVEYEGLASDHKLYFAAEVFRIVGVAADV